MTLPPGQRAIEAFPRFGTHGRRPPPEIPSDPRIAIRGAVTKSLAVGLSELRNLPRHQERADLHCVAGWSATGLTWEGIRFEDFYRAVIEPALAPGSPVRHLVFEGLDGYRSFVEIDDALDHRVLIADHLDGEPLNADHGGPVRLVSPNQYGFISTKHLCAIEVHSGRPAANYHPSPLIQFGLQLVKPHRRARVWQEERHRYMPGWLVRPVYLRIIPIIRSLSARGARGSAPTGSR